MMEFWCVERDWEGETCAIMASGPSMTYELSDRIRRLGVRSIGVNNQGIDVKNSAGEVKLAMCPWADILYAADQLWWHHNREAALAFKGIKVAIQPASGGLKRESEEVRMMGNGGRHGFDERNTHLRTGGNSGYQAIHLAVHLGVKKILLFGFDMHGKNGQHWFGYHSWRDGHEGNYNLFRARFDTLAPELRKREIEVLNCTPGSALECFTMSTIEEVETNGLQCVRESASSDAGNSETTSREARKDYGTAQAGGAT